MKQQIGDRDAMDDMDSLLIQEIGDNGQPHMPSASHFNPTPPNSNDAFLEQMLSLVHSSDSFPWGADDQLDSSAEDPSKMRQHHITKALMLQQQLLSRGGLTAAESDSGGGGGGGGVLHIPPPDFNDLGDAYSFKPANLRYAGSMDQISNLPQHFQQPPQSYSFPDATMVSSGEAAAGQPRQRVRARRGQATDPHSIAERLRRERIAERMKSLQELVPNANKTDKASMLDEIIDYVKFLQLQVKVLSMSRLGGASLGNPLSSEGKGINGARTAPATNIKDGRAAAEHQVVRLMEEDMGSAMQYLQGKGLCLMPISLATAISTATCHTSNPLAPSSNNLKSNGVAAAASSLLDAGRPASPSTSILTVQSATVGVNGAREISAKDGSSVNKLD